MTMGFTISGQVLTLVIIYIIYNCNADSKFELYI